MENVAHFVFIDQHKKTSRVGIGDSTGHHLRQFDVDHREKGLERLKRELGKLEGKVIVGLEATGFYDWMVEWLRKDCGVEVRMGHPTAMKYITKAKNKTDGKDVERGLKLLGTDQFPEAYIPTPEERELRWLMTMRERIWKMQGQVRNSIRALLSRMNVELPQRVLESKGNLQALRELKLATVYRTTLDELLSMLDSLSLRQTKLDGIIEEKAETDPLAAWWDSHAGIGPQTAVALRAYIADPGRFANRKKIASYLGLTPRVHNSAETVQHGGIDRQGPPILRRLLGQVAYIMVRRSPEAQAYLTWLARRRGPKRAIVAVTRKFIVGLHAAWRHKETFDPARCFEIPRKKEYVLSTDGVAASKG